MGILCLSSIYFILAFLIAIIIIAYLKLGFHYMDY